VATAAAASATASSSSLPCNEDAAVSAHLARASDNATTSGTFCLLLQHVILPLDCWYLRCYLVLTLFKVRSHSTGSIGDTQGPVQALTSS